MQTEELNTFFYTCLYPKRTNLKYFIWVDDTACERRGQENSRFRLKYGKTFNECITIDFGSYSNSYTYSSRMEINEQELATVFKWISLNHRLLMRYYQDEDYDSVDFIYDMTAVK